MSRRDFNHAVNHPSLSRSPCSGDSCCSLRSCAAPTHRSQHHLKILGPDLALCRQCRQLFWRGLCWSSRWLSIGRFSFPGNLRLYRANPDQENAHLLQRHANRFQTGGDDDGVIDQFFAVKLTNFTSTHECPGFTGPLTFLNTYKYPLKDNGLLTGLGASTEFMAGVTFWNRYGRTIYNATVGELTYNASYPNGTARPKPVLRTTGQSRIENSQINWALGFFGPSFQTTPNPTLANFTNEFDVVIIPEGGTENNTLASYDSCFNDNDPVTGYLGDLDLFQYIPLYLGAATARLQKYAPSGFTITVNDTYAMQSICAYETNYIGVSDFCTLFTQDEWAGFENTLDMECKLQRVCYFFYLVQLTDPRLL